MYERNLRGKECVGGQATCFRRQFRKNTFGKTDLDFTAQVTPMHTVMTQSLRHDELMLSHALVLKETRAGDSLPHTPAHAHAHG